MIYLTVWKVHRFQLQSLEGRKAPEIPLSGSFVSISRSSFKFNSLVPMKKSDPFIDNARPPFTPRSGLGFKSSMAYAKSIVNECLVEWMKFRVGSSCFEFPTNANSTVHIEIIFCVFFFSFVSSLLNVISAFSFLKQNIYFENFKFFFVNKMSLKRQRFLMLLRLLSILDSGLSFPFSCKSIIIFIRYPCVFILFAQRFITKNRSLCLCDLNGWLLLLILFDVVLYLFERKPFESVWFFDLFIYRWFITHYHYYNHYYLAILQKQNRVNWCVSMNKYLQNSKSKISWIGFWWN